jgi:hypothetical protein
MPRPPDARLFGRGNVCKKAFVFAGNGDNGKSTFTTLIQLALGDYACVQDDRALVCTLPDVQRGEVRIQGRKPHVIYAISSFDPEDYDGVPSHAPGLVRHV